MATPREMFEELEKDPMIGKLVYPRVTAPEENLLGVYLFERWTATPQMILDTYAHRMSQVSWRRTDVEPTTDTRVESWSFQQAQNIHNEYGHAYFIKEARALGYTLTYRYNICANLGCPEKDSTAQ